MNKCELCGSCNMARGLDGAYDPFDYKCLNCWALYTDGKLSKGGKMQNAEVKTATEIYNDVRKTLEAQGLTPQSAAEIAGDEALAEGQAEVVARSTLPAEPEQVPTSRVLLAQRAALIMYMHAMISVEDWHAVSDAACDLRVCDARMGKPGSV